MSGAWFNPYMAHMYTIRAELGVFTAYRSPSNWLNISSSHFLNISNAALTRYSCVDELSTFSRSRYVCENELSSMITKFKFDHADLGNKAPRPGYNRKPFCPLCPVLQRTSCFHLLFVCHSLAPLRVTTGIQSFINSTSINGISLESAFKMFVNGLDSNKKPVAIETYFERAKCMTDMRLEWLSKW